VRFLYADTSALVRAYFADEPDHTALRELLLHGADPVVSSELARLEFASAVMAARRAGRLRKAQTVLDRFDADCGDEGPLTLVRCLQPGPVLAAAFDLVRRHCLRTLDALHLAVALTDVSDLAAGLPVVLVTRDEAQAHAAVAAGLTTV
jgi:predicted nucleic acid-binding protein